MQQPHIAAIESGDRALSDETAERILSTLRADPTEVVRSRKTEVYELARERGISVVKVFGSVARNESTADSDVDFIVDWESPDDRDTLQMISFGKAAQQSLGFPVDVVHPPYSEDGRMQWLQAKSEAVDLIDF